MRIGRLFGAGTNYSGQILCQKLSTSRNLLQAPVSIVIDGQKVVLTRPVFSIAGNYVVSNEIALGSISASGELQVESHYEGAEDSFVGNYSGDLKGESGLLRGAQQWKMAKGGESRPCSIAFTENKQSVPTEIKAGRIPAAVCAR